MEPDRAVVVTSVEQISQMYKAWNTSLMSLLAEKCGDELGQRITSNLEERFFDLVADLPYIGGPANPLTNTLVWSAYWLAVYQVLKEQGKNVLEVGELIYEDFQKNTARFTEDQMLKIGAERFTSEYIQQQRTLAVESQKREFEGGWEFYFIEGDNAEFDYGLDYKECGICTFYHKHGADELVQFICLTDFYSSAKLGLGLERNQTIADGFDVCNFRYKRGRETRPNWVPDFLKK